MNLLRRRLLLFALLFGFFLFTGMAYYDTNAIVVKHYELKDSPLVEVLSNLKIAFLTDLHIFSSAATIMEVNFF